MEPYCKACLRSAWPGHASHERHGTVLQELSMMTAKREKPECMLLHAPRIIGNVDWMSNGCHRLADMLRDVAHLCSIRIAVSSQSFTLLAHVSQQQ